MGTPHFYTAKIRKSGSNKGEQIEGVYKPERVKPIIPKRGQGGGYDFITGDHEIRGEYYKNRTNYNLWLKYLRLADELHRQGILIRVSVKGQPTEFHQVPDPRYFNKHLNPDTTFGKTGFQKWFDEHKPVFERPKAEFLKVVDLMAQGKFDQVVMTLPKTRKHDLQNDVGEYYAEHRSEGRDYDKPILPIQGRLNYHTQCNVFNTTYHRLTGMPVSEIQKHPHIRAVNKAQQDRFKASGNVLQPEEYGFHSNRPQIGQWLHNGACKLFGAAYGVFACKNWKEVLEAKENPPQLMG